MEDKDYLKVAKECGATIEWEPDLNEWRGKKHRIIFHSENALDAYTSRILASQQAAHDAEIAKLKEDLSNARSELGDLFEKANKQVKEHRSANERIAYLETLVALKDNALILAQIGSCSCLTMTNNPAYHSEHCPYRVMAEAISASAETVQAFRDKLTEPLRARIAELESQLNRPHKPN